MVSNCYRKRYLLEANSHNVSIDTKNKANNDYEGLSAIKNFQTGDTSSLCK